MKSILITGGTGSFGQAFVRDLLSHNYIERIVVFSRGEHKQAEMADEIRPLDKEGDNRRLRFFIGDVRDRERLERAFEGIDVVVHAAALKRIEVGQYNPEEMVKTNVIGAMNVIEAAQTAKVKKVVFLSSDKAYQPVSPYGQSKSIAESLFLNANNTTREDGTLFSVTRYGNVWGTQGSVVPKWRKILESGNTVPVSDPECTRFYMSLKEAVDFVWDAIGKMKGGELFLPNLPAYRLADLAKAMGANMDVLGLPDWEKYHEGMSWSQQSNQAPRLSVDDLREILRADDASF